VSDPLVSEAGLRLAVFAGVLGAMAAWEILAPRRRLRARKRARWRAHLALGALDAAAVRLLFPAGAVGAAAAAAERGWGLLHRLELPAAWSALFAVVALDLAVYLQHLSFHAFPPLWRVHRVHHADLDFDVTTAIRFHPIEILLSMLYKVAVILLLGLPVAGVLWFEVLLNASALFNHGNVRLPRWLDRALRRVLVTPDVHRIHHSVLPAESNRNFGFCLSFWDRLFGTWLEQPAWGHEGMPIGLEELQALRRERLGWILALPFRCAASPRSPGFVASRARKAPSGPTAFTPGRRPRRRSRTGAAGSRPPSAEPAARRGSRFRTPR
jgi:sterol desaturase/sphingolipid hydroxylase (fatty acid hydroxylase superfamily)